MSQMIQQAVAEFFAKVNTDPALQQEVVKALEGKENAMEAATSFSQVGTLYGYEFTAEEAATMIQEIAASSAHLNLESEGELSDEALESVAGGLGPMNLNARGFKEKFAIEVMGLAAKSLRPSFAAGNPAKEINATLSGVSVSMRLSDKSTPTNAIYDVTATRSTLIKTQTDAGTISITFA